MLSTPKQIREVVRVQEKPKSVNDVLFCIGAKRMNEALLPDSFDMPHGLSVEEAKSPSSGAFVIGA